MRVRTAAAATLAVAALGALPLFLWVFRAGPSTRRRVDASTEQRIDAATVRSTAWLLAQQSDDGAFRKSVYGAMRDGFSLTPIALKTLAYLPGPEARAAARRAANWLAGRVRGGPSGADEAGAIDAGPFGLAYPVYASALAVMGLARLGEPAHERAREAWLRHLLDQQYTERLGFGPDDPGYGGFGYGRARARPPGGSLPGAPANLSATLFAVGALRAAGRRSDDPSLGAARRFVASCRNEDGGFFASPVDEVLNKAGGRASYGSATADGLRALIACGEPFDSPLIAGARRWLSERFLPDRHPGDFAPERVALRDGYYFYYAWSVAHALVRAPAPEPAWAGTLARELLRRRLPDGTWRNTITDGREDDPLVATCLALGALANCRAALRDD